MKKHRRLEIHGVVACSTTVEARVANRHKVWAHWISIRILVKKAEEKAWSPQFRCQVSFVRLCRRPWTFEWLIGPPAPGRLPMLELQDFRVNLWQKFSFDFRKLLCHSFQPEKKANFWFEDKNWNWGENLVKTQKINKLFVWREKLKWS